MKYGIVVNAYIRNNSQITKANRIAEELKNLGAECEIIKNVNLAEIASGKALSVKYDGVIFLDKDKAAARLLEKNGIKLSNSANAHSYASFSIRLNVLFFAVSAIRLHAAE